MSDIYINLIKDKVNSKDELISGDALKLLGKFDDLKIKEIVVRYLLESVKISKIEGYYILFDKEYDISKKTADKIMGNTLVYDDYYWYYKLMIKIAAIISLDKYGYYYYDEIDKQLGIKGNWRFNIVCLLLSKMIIKMNGGYLKERLLTRLIKLVKYGNDLNYMCQKEIIEIIGDLQMRDMISKIIMLCECNNKYLAGYALQNILKLKDDGKTKKYVIDKIKNTKELTIKIMGMIGINNAINKIDKKYAWGILKKAYAPIDIGFVINKMNNSKLVYKMVRNQLYTESPYVYSCIINRLIIDKNTNYVSLARKYMNNRTGRFKLYSIYYLAQCEKIK